MAPAIHALAALVHDTRDARRHHRVDLCFQVRLFKLVDPAGIQDGSPSLFPADALGEGGFTENVSSGGLGLRWERGLTDAAGLVPGERVLAEIRIPRAHRNLRCLGRVAWVQPEGERYFRAGVAFEGVNLEELSDLQDFLTVAPPA